MDYNDRDNKELEEHIQQQFAASLFKTIEKLTTNKIPVNSNNANVK